jgi:phosphoribosylaminoimidazolecarboxamide formyltransferase/IMP cyclohydrolase
MRGNATHEKECKEHGIAPIDMVVCNLYPFEHTVAKGSDFETCIENIDIGGPSMVIKNFALVSQIVVWCVVSVVDCRFYSAW